MNSPCHRLQFLYFHWVIKLNLHWKCSLHYFSWEAKWPQPFFSVLHGWKKIRFSFQGFKLGEERKEIYIISWVTLSWAQALNLGNTNTSSIRSPVWKRRPTCASEAELPRAAASYLKQCFQTVDLLQHLFTICYLTSLRTRIWREALNIALSAEGSSDIGRGTSWPSLAKLYYKQHWNHSQVFKVSTWLCEQIFGLEVLLVIICSSFSLICSLSFK